MMTRRTEQRLRQLEQHPSFRRAPAVTAAEMVAKKRELADMLGLDIDPAAPFREWPLSGEDLAELRRALEDRAFGRRARSSPPSPAP